MDWGGDFPEKSIFNIGPSRVTLCPSDTGKIIMQRRDVQKVNVKGRNCQKKEEERGSEINQYLT